MKKQFLFHFLFATTLGFAQAPQFLNYQAIARTASGPVANSFVKLQFTVHERTSGNIIYQEAQGGVSTNPYGLFTAQIGGGSVSSGTFYTINWGTGAKYL